MTIEEFRDFANCLKNNYTIDFDKLPEFCDMAISALSTEGEYIKKSELLQHVTTEELSDFKDCDVIHAEEIDKLITYSFSDSAENKGEWIPVFERLPEMGVRVLCACQANLYDVLKLTPNGWFYDTRHTYMFGFVLAWQPLPEPYKGGDS